MKVTAQKTESNDFSLNYALSPKDERLHIIELVRRWGGLTTDALLDPACHIFHIPQIEGFIGYRKACQCAVVYGNPVCAPKDIPQLTQAFHAFCQDQIKNIIYLTVSKEFAKWASEHLCKVLIEYGEEIYLDPHCNPQEKQGTHASLIRRKIRHAQHAGVIIKEYLVFDAKLEKALEQVRTAWLQERHGPQVHISNVYLFQDRTGKRWFYAQQGERIIGIVVLNQLQSRQGWHLNHLMFIPEAPSGVSELLISVVLKTLANEDCSFISFGAVPSKQLGEIIGLTNFSAWMVRQAYQIANRIFHLAGHKVFWGKFDPQTRPSYLLFSQPHVGFREVYALMQAMNVSF